MLGEHNIVAMSPEVGTDSKNSEKFYLNKGYIAKVVSDFYPTVKYFICMHQSNLV
jgi:hypothetical protein